MLRNRLLCLFLLFCMAPLHGQAQAGPYRTTISAAGHYLTIELLDDDLAHFEISPTAPAEGPIWASPMVAKTDYPGPSLVEQPTDDEILTPEMRLQIDAESLCVTIIDRTRDPELTLTTACPFLNDDNAINGLTFSAEGTTDVYGLGEQFRRRGGTDGNLMGDRRLMTNAYGNSLASFNGGNVGNAQFPIMYALGEDTHNYAIFVDHVYQQFWGFNADPFVMRTAQAPIRWYVMTGSDLPDLRADYMELTGRPPVPPQQLFGLWVSEYGYDDWAELSSVLASLREADFPVDGFLLDLLWFGGIAGESQMGSLTWDEANFPDAKAFIAQLRDEEGVSLMTIEEPYVAQSAENYQETLDAGVLVRDCADCDPVSLSGWWGFGGMVDWSDPDAAAWWHDVRRQPLVDAGIIGHWTDLGEPENYSEAAWYAGLPELDMHDEAAIHNLYNLLWSASIWDGYARNDVDQRPFSLSRSGTSGSQRYGVAMWSGDIAANMLSLTEQMNVQMQMSLSGIDYFGADVGGFYRQAFDPVLGMEGMYSVWLANAALLDVPLRPHAANQQNTYQTAPSLIGDVESNLANVRLRYELSPYLYTLAHRAYRTGEAIYPPLVYAFQEDMAVRTMGSQKMIGDQMMMATLTDYDPEITTVYLPEGGWFDYHTGAYTRSAGETVDVSSDEVLQAPLFVRDGAILPLMPVDAETLNVLGQRADGTQDESIVLNIYHAAEDGTFTLIEDDGQTMAYQDGAVRETTITHRAEGDNLIVTIQAAGTYAGAPDARPVTLRLYSPERTVGQVLLNGEALPVDDDPGWIQADSGVVEVHLGMVPMDEPQTITFEPEQTSQAEAAPQEADVAAIERPLLLAHYMPWYQTPDISGYWGWHWTMDHFNPSQTDEEGRAQIASQFMPLTGPYDSADEAVLEYQVLLMKLSGIDGVIADWYGTADFNDYATINAATEKLFETITRAGLKFAICYEDRTLTNIVNATDMPHEDALQQGQADLQYAQQNWLSSEAYVTYQGQPLWFIFGPLYFRQPSDWETIFTGIEPTPGLVTLDGHMGFAALTSYPWPPMEMSGGIELPQSILQSYLERFYRNAERTEMIVGTAFPGFYDIYAEADVRSSYGYIDARDGDTLRETLAMALAANPEIIQLATWNDYGEGTTIEPTEDYGYTRLEIIQQTRQTIDSDFAATPDDLQMPFMLLQARRTYADDAEANQQLDAVFDAIVAGDLETARTILAEYPAS